MESIAGVSSDSGGEEACACVLRVTVTALYSSDVSSNTELFRPDVGYGRLRVESIAGVSRGGELKEAFDGTATDCKRGMTAPKSSRRRRRERRVHGAGDSTKDAMDPGNIGECSD